MRKSSVRTYDIIPGLQPVHIDGGRVEIVLKGERGCISVPSVSQLFYMRAIDHISAVGEIVHRVGKHPVNGIQIFIRGFEGAGDVTVHSDAVGIQILRGWLVCQTFQQDVSETVMVELVPEDIRGGVPAADEGVFGDTSVEFPFPVQMVGIAGGHGIAGCHPAVEFYHSVEDFPEIHEPCILSFREDGHRSHSLFDDRILAHLRSGFYARDGYLPYGTPRDIL